VRQFCFSEPAKAAACPCIAARGLLVLTVLLMQVGALTALLSFIVVLARLRNELFGPICDRSAHWVRALFL